MDKELIAMCDCPEIQDRWEPKDGDRTYIKGDVELGEHIVDLYLHSMGSDEYEEMGDDERLEAVKPQIKRSYIYIPRIEDVLEWVGEEWLHCLVRQSDEEIGDDTMSDERWLVSVFNKEGCSYDGAYANTAIQSLIKAYMHLEHNKTWNGEAWV